MTKTTVTIELSKNYLENIKSKINMSILLTLTESGIDMEHAKYLISKMDYDVYLKSINIAGE